MKDEALRLALEALEGMYIPNFTMDDSPINNAITAIKQALAQPEQEPEAWMNPYGDVILFRVTRQEIKHYTIPLYASPPKREWQGLTDWEINSVANNNNPLDGIRSFARAIEAKLKAKNGFPQTEKNT